MSNSAELDAGIAISSAFVVGYTRGEHSCRPLTSVSINVNFARIQRSFAAYGRFSALFHLLSVNGTVAPGILGSTCTWGWLVS
jgi:hypothetical protein